MAFRSSTVHSQVGNRLDDLKMLRYPLEVGSYEYYEKLYSGGAVKFHAESHSNFVFGDWGWYINGGQTAEMVIPVSAAAGGTISAASIKMDLVGTDYIFLVQFIAIDALGGETVIADTIGQAEDWSEVPAGVLGRSMKFKIRITNSSGSQVRVGDDIWMNFTVSELTAPEDCADVIAMDLGLAGDMDSDCDVDIDDFATLAGVWLADCAVSDCGLADLNDSGVVDLEDFADMSGHYGLCNRPGDSECVENW